METRQITQIKIHKLVLNPMRDNTESGTMVAISYDRDKLIEWCNSQRAPEMWKDYGESHFPNKGDFKGYENSNHCWHKTFSKGSPLEWYNPCNDDFVPGTFGHGIHEEWATQEAINNFLERTAFTGVQLIQ